MSVKVCDALCGFGKTSACIRMMNEKTDTKFIFVTQFLTEVERIKQGCAQRQFVSPTSQVRRGQTKLSDIHRLMEEGRNIATTHSLFISYTDVTKELIKNQGYTLVLDESVDVLAMSEMIDLDLDILKKSEAVKEKDGVIEWMLEDYLAEEGGKFREEVLRARSKNFLRFEEHFFFWSIPPELFTCFKDVYVLTYMFQAQPLKCFFDVYKIDYGYIGVRKNKGVYEFCAADEMNRAVNLVDKIHILEDTKINSIGDGRTALSVSWYKRVSREDNSLELDKLRKNISNVFKNIYKAPAARTLWTTYKDYRSELTGNGYGTSFISYNMRASNSYADRNCLAYCVNNFPRPMEKRYYYENGSEWDADMYALSTLIQWLFRSAIRKGEEIWIYVPSERMRWLLKEWLQNLAKGEDLTPLQYETTRARRTPKKKDHRGRKPAKITLVQRKREKERLKNERV